MTKKKYPLITVIVNFSYQKVEYFWTKVISSKKELRVKSASSHLGHLSQQFLGSEENKIVHPIQATPCIKMRPHLYKRAFPLVCWLVGNAFVKFGEKWKDSKS